MSIFLFARAATIISAAVFLVIVAMLGTKQVLAQIATARKWTCADGTLQLGNPTNAIWDPDADRLVIIAYASYPNNRVMAWDVSKPPNTGCTAIAFDGTLTSSTESSIGLLATKNR